jgi:hypothetical protein
MKIMCPDYNKSGTSKQWEKATKDYCGEYITPFVEGYGRFGFGYHCPHCFQFVNALRLKEANKGVIIK